jgi:hypothetical protein
MEIKLTQTGKHKIEVIKLIRLFTDLSLKECKYIIDNTPFVFIVSKPEFDFEQIKKNFEAIGAKVEKIEPIKNIKPKPGEDIKEKPLKPKSLSKAHTYKKDKKVLAKSKTEKTQAAKWSGLKKTLDNEKSINDILFAKKVQQSLFVAIAASAISTGIGFYAQVSYIIIYSIIGIAAAIPLKGISPQKPTDAGILAAAFTLFAYVIKPVFFYIFYLIRLNEIGFFGSSNLFSRYFHIIYPSVFIPVIIAFVIAYILNGGKKTDIKNMKTKSGTKTHKKKNKSLRRKNRKLD